MPHEPGAGKPAATTSPANKPPDESGNVNQSLRASDHQDLKEFERESTRPSPSGEALQQRQGGEQTDAAASDVLDPSVDQPLDAYLARLVEAEDRTIEKGQKHIDAGRG